AGDKLVVTLKGIAKLIEPGINSQVIDDYVKRSLKKHVDIPEQKVFQDNPYSTSASINDEICHGFTRLEALKECNNVTIDMVVNYNEALADSAWSYAVGNVDEKGLRLMEVTKKALYTCIEQAQVNSRIGDIGHAIQQYVEGKGFTVVREFTGHGIGPT